MRRMTLKSHSTICVFTKSHKHMWVSYVRGTPKMSQSGPLIYWITHMHWSLHCHKLKSLNMFKQIFRDVRVQILIWFQTFLLFTIEPHFQTFNALKITSFQAFQIISNFFSQTLAHPWIFDPGCVPLGTLRTPNKYNISNVSRMNDNLHERTHKFPKLLSTRQLYTLWYDSTFSIVLMAIVIAHVIVF